MLEQIHNKMTDAQLNRCRKNLCPHCESDQIEGQEVEIGAGEAWQDVCCLDCEAEWRECYTLTDFAPYGSSDEADEDGLEE